MKLDHAPGPKWTRGPPRFFESRTRTPEPVIHTSTQLAPLVPLNELVSQVDDATARISDRLCDGVDQSRGVYRVECQLIAQSEEGTPERSRVVLVVEVQLRSEHHGIHAD
jgi:hypothetical protein